MNEIKELLEMKNKSVIQLITLDFWATMVFQSVLMVFIIFSILELITNHDMWIRIFFSSGMISCVVLDYIVAKQHIKKTKNILESYKRFVELSINKIEIIAFTETIIEEHEGNHIPKVEDLL